MKSGISLIVLNILVGWTLAFVAPVSADQEQTANYTYISKDANCTWGDVILDHGDGGGYIRTGVLSKWALNHPWYTTQCGDSFARPPDHLAVKAKLEKHDGSNWVLCWESSWMFNSGNQFSYPASRSFGTVAPCGNGWYRLHGASYVNVNDQWFGGWMRTENHFLPVN